MALWKLITNRKSSKSIPVENKDDLDDRMLNEIKKVSYKDLAGLLDNGGKLIDVRSEKEYKDLIHRLNRIEGQIRGIKGMVEDEVYCTDILIQVSAAKAALDSFNKVLLSNHIKTCVTEDIKAGKEETVDELVVLLQKLMK